MDAPDVKRRLTCLLAMDAVGYSRLVAENETNALRVLAAHRAVIDGIIAFHSGRIVNTAGDSVLAEFGSVVDGVRCAVEIQDALRTRNESLPEAQRMLFRIGLNLGEVVVKGTDLLGDGVNVAARLQSIAEPGGILVSSSVYDQITGKLDLGFDDIGEQALKNISRPIRAFRVSGAGGTTRPAPGAAAPAKHAARRGPAWAVIAALTAIAAIALSLAWWQGFIGPERDAAPAVASLATDHARIEAELAAERRARAEAEAVALRAKAESDAAALKAQAERDAAATRAKAEFDAAVAKAKALEASRAAEAAKAKAIAPATAPVAPSPAPPATPPAAPAAAPTPPVAAAPPAQRADAGATRFDGDWIATEQCGPMEQYPAFTRQHAIRVRNGEFVLERGKAGDPGYIHLEGHPDERGGLVLTGQGISGVEKYRGKRFETRFEGSFADGRFTLYGKLGARRCRLTLERAGVTVPQRR